MAAAASVLPVPAQNEPHVDFLPLRGTDHVEFFVGNARQAAYFYRAAFGMSLVAYAGPETGRRDRVSYVLQQGKVRFVLTTAAAAGQRDCGSILRGMATAFARLRCGSTMRGQAWEETTKRGARQRDRADRNCG